MNKIVTVRDVEIVTAEIVTIKRQAQQVLITAAIEIGRRLTEVKAMVPHGEWGRYLEERVEYSQSTANNMMKIYREYGSEQESLFDGFAKSQAFANLNYTQALALLSVPAEDRERFAEENDVANKSTREIQELIRQQEVLEAALEASEEKCDDVKKRLAELQTRASVAEARVADREKEVENLRGLIRKAEEAEKKAKADLKAAKDNPVVSDDQMAAIRKEAETTAKAQAAAQAEKDKKKLQGKLDAALVAVQKAENDKKQAEMEAKDLRRKIDSVKAETRLANPAAAVFKSLWEQVQNLYNQMNNVRLNIAQQDPAMAEALANGIKAMLKQWETQLQ